MGQSSADRQRAYRQRGTEARQALEALQAEFAAFKAKARQFAEQQLAEIGRLDAELEQARSGQPSSRCRRCGHEMACPACYRADGQDSDEP